jgi:hypothetical protein
MIVRDRIAAGATPASITRPDEILMAMRRRKR